MRDSQRSRVYAWERRVVGGTFHRPTMQSLDEVEAFLRPIWAAERGRYGMAKVPMPVISRNLWGQRRATGCSSELKLPKWARSPWVVLHEATHALIERYEPGGWHGPRFVGALIGVVSRHLGYNAAELMARADAMGVKYYVRSIGSVPVFDKPRLLLDAARRHGPMTEMDYACELDWSYLQVRAAAMHLIRRGQARWLRKKLVLLDGSR